MIFATEKKKNLGPSCEILVNKKYKAKISKLTVFFMTKHFYLYS